MHSTKGALRCGDDHETSFQFYCLFHAKVNTSGVLFIFGLSILPPPLWKPYESAKHPTHSSMQHIVHHTFAYLHVNTGISAVTYVYVYFKNNYILRSIIYNIYIFSQLESTVLNTLADNDWISMRALVRVCVCMYNIHGRCYSYIGTIRCRWMVNH